MDDEAVAGFIGITDAAPHVAQYFLNLTSNDVMQAVGLFYDSPELVATIPQEQAQTAASSAPSGAPSRIVHTGDNGVVHVDSDEEPDEPMDEADQDAAMAQRIEDDEAMARAMQEEMYEGGITGNDVRAPIARRTETLVGPGADWGGVDETAIEQQMARIRQRQAGMQKSSTLCQWLMLTNS